jgi:acyl carrier protein
VVKVCEHNNMLLTALRSFRQFPRILLSRFFTAPEVPKSATELAKASTIKAAPRQAPTTIVADRRAKKTTADVSHQVSAPAPVAQSLPEAPKTVDISPSDSSASTVSSEGIATPPSGETLNSGADTVADKALLLIAQETALEVSDLEDAAEFANLGIDSLMSLVLTEKLRSNLNVKVNGSLFLDYPVSAWSDQQTCGVSSLTSSIDYW